MRDGQHRNPTGRPQYFTTSFFHRPDDLRAEVIEAGFALEKLVGVQGPGWLAKDLDRRWADPQQRSVILGLLQQVESEETLLGVSLHLLAVARKASRAP